MQPKHSPSHNHPSRLEISQLKPFVLDPNLLGYHISQKKQERSIMSVTHVVLFRFKPHATPEDVKAVRMNSPPRHISRTPLTSLSSRYMSQTCDSFRALKTSCIHPTTKTPYILSLKGGRDNSPEGLQVCAYVALGLRCGLFRGFL